MGRPPKKEWNTTKEGIEKKIKERFLDLAKKVASK